MQEEYWSNKSENDELLTRHDVLKFSMDFRQETLTGPGACSTLPGIFSQLKKSINFIEEQEQVFRNNVNKHWDKRFHEKNSGLFQNLRSNKKLKIKPNEIETARALIKKLL
jgi:hypothetical protein